MGHIGVQIYISKSRDTMQHIGTNISISKSGCSSRSVAHLGRNMNQWKLGTLEKICKVVDVDRIGAILEYIDKCTLVRVGTSGKRGNI